MPDHTPAELVGFVPTTDLDRAIPFFHETLGLRFLERNQFAAVFGPDEHTVRVVKVEAFVPQPFTILGWRTFDIRSTVERLSKRGLSFIRYPHFEQDDAGVWTAPSGAKVVWFHDLDGNVLSYTEIP